jgi:hypothetical protein
LLREWRDFFYGRGDNLLQRGGAFVISKCDETVVARVEEALSQQKYENYSGKKSDNHYDKKCLLHMLMNFDRLGHSQI